MSDVFRPLHPGSASLITRCYRAPTRGTASKVEGGRHTKWRAKTVHARPPCRGTPNRPGPRPSKSASSSESRRPSTRDRYARRRCLTAARHDGIMRIVPKPLWIGVPLAVCAFALAGATGASPGAQVRFEIEVSGKGTVRAEWGAHKRRVECRASCTRSSTFHTFGVDAGTVVLKAWPARAWMFTGWSRACRGSQPTCVLRVQRSTRVKATFVPPP